MLEELHTGYGPEGASRIRVHGAASSSSYTPAVSEDWQDAPEGVDVIQNQELIRRHFPTFDTEVSTILHVRRAGDISGQQLGSLMLEEIRAAGGTVSLARVTEIVRQDGSFALKMRSEEGEQTLDAEILVNAAGPYVADIAQMLGEALPVENVFHQKIAFADNLGAIDRRMPFSIDLDAARSVSSSRRITQRPGSLARCRVGSTAARTAVITESGLSSVGPIIDSRQNRRTISRRIPTFRISF